MLILILLLACDDQLAIPIGGITKFCSRSADINYLLESAFQFFFLGENHDFLFFIFYLGWGVGWGSFTYVIISHHTSL